MKLLIAAAPGSEPQADALAAHLGAAGRLTLQSRRFPDAERYLRVEGDAAAASIVVVAALRDPDPQALGLLFLADCLRELGATRVGLAAPYLPYMRQDHRFLDGEAVSSRSFARFLSSCFDWIATVDPHLHRFGALSDLYAVPTAAASSARPIGRWISRHVAAPLIVGPDQESRQWVDAIAQAIGCPCTVLTKQRRGDREVEISPPDGALARGRTPVVVDDIISSAQTMCATVRHLAALGTQPVCIGVHALLADEALDDLRRAGAAQVVTCNTLVHPTNAIDVLPELAASVRALA
jgi:ribose-phosphate pyrophosphokinase